MSASEPVGPAPPEPPGRAEPDPPGRAKPARPGRAAPDPPGRAEPDPQGRRRRERKSVLLRLDPEVHEALARWASDDLRSTNAHIEWLLRRAVIEAGRLRRDP